MSDNSPAAPKHAQEKEDDVLATLHNPAKDKNSGQVWPIFLLIIAVSIGWFLKDPDLRRGLGEITGFHAIEPIVETVINRENLITVHGTWTSSCTQRVLVVAREKDLEIEMKLVNMTAMQHKTPEHLAMHPFGQIPVLQVNEATYVFESRAIANYLDRRWAKRGLSFAIDNGTTPNVYYDQALSFEAFDFDPVATAIYKEAVMTPRTAVGGAINEIALNASLAIFDQKLDAYERILSQPHRPFLGGNMTLADLYHLPLGTKLVEAGYGQGLLDEKRRPHVARWWKAIYERPSWQAVLKDIADWKEQEAKLAEERAKAAEQDAKNEAYRKEHEHDADHDDELGLKEKKHHGIFH